MKSRASKQSMKCHRQNEASQSVSKSTAVKQSSRNANSLCQELKETQLIFTVMNINTICLQTSTYNSILVRLSIVKQIAY